MAPNIFSTDSKTLTEKDLQNEESSIITKTIDENNKQNRSESYIKTEGWFKMDPKWINIVSIYLLHLCFVYSRFTFNFFENLLTIAWRKYSLKNSFINLIINELIIKIVMHDRSPLSFCFLINAIFQIFSVAHIWGSKPYDAQLKATQSLFVNCVTGGEGSHNYHHVFPWNYKTSEFNDFLTTKYLNFFSKIGWAYDFKEASEELAKTVAMNRGDGSHSLWKAVPASKIE
ncbi:DESAT conjugase, partial [Acromyrmex charruanus]